MKIFLKVVYILLSIKLINLTIISEINSEKWLNEVLRKIENNILIISKEKYIEKFPVENIDNNTYIIFNNKLYKNIMYQKYSTILMALDNITEFKNIIDIIISNNSTFNAKTKILLLNFGNENLKHFFEISWKYHITNINIISNNNLYTYFPYKNRKCGKYIQTEILNLRYIEPNTKYVVFKYKPGLICYVLVFQNYSQINFLIEWMDVKSV